MKHLTVSESKNYISGFYEIGVLPLVLSLRPWAVMPVSAVALDDDRIVGKLEIDHELIKHDYLLIEGDAVLAQSGGHCLFYVGTLAGSDALEHAKHPVRLAAILLAAISRWVSFKFLSAVGADNGDFGFPFVIIGAEFGGKFAGGKKALFGAIQSVLAYTLAHLKLFSALLADAGYFWGFFVNLFGAITGIDTVGGAVLCFTCAARHNIKLFSAENASFRDTRRLSALFRTKDMFSSGAAGFGHINRLAASGAGVKRHKRNLLSNGWHVCLGHAVPTGGIHNYIRLGANHQTRTCPKQLHYSISVRGSLVA